MKHLCCPRETLLLLDRECTLRQTFILPARMTKAHWVLQPTTTGCSRNETLWAALKQNHRKYLSAAMKPILHLTKRLCGKHLTHTTYNTHTGMNRTSLAASTDLKVCDIWFPNTHTQLQLDTKEYTHIHLPSSTPELMRKSPTLIEGPAQVT